MTQRPLLSASVSSVVAMSPRGHYLADEVGQLAGVSGKMIGAWSRRKYIPASQRERPYPKVYAYQDVAEAIAVHELIDAGASLRIIRKTIEGLRHRYGRDWPLSTSQVAYGEGNTFEMADERPIAIAVKAGNQLLNREWLIGIGAVLQKGGWAARDLPELRHIEVDPDRLSGRPTIRGRRIAAEDVAITALTDPSGRETLHEGYDLSDAEIDDAIRWWDRVQEYESVAYAIASLDRAAIRRMTPWSNVRWTLRRKHRKRLAQQTSIAP